MKLVISLLLLCAVDALREQPVVVTKKGPIRGQDRGNYTTFFGIPYALVDERNPFGESLAHPDFVSPFNATDPSIKCPQTASRYPESGILQCLHLNIFVPKTSKKNLPVFLWIHGGGFSFGNGGSYDGRYLVQHDIIVVTISYRLGPYGFLCLDTDDVPGNQGMKDQVTAMRWVKENIMAFGGDPNEITIAGESSGGGSVELHLYSEAEKLFDKAIIQSGAVDVLGLIAEPNKDAAYTLAKIFDPNVTRQNSLSVLAKQDPIEVMKALQSSKLSLRACIEKRLPENQGTKNFITSSDFYAPHSVSGTPIIIGYNSKETFGDYETIREEYYANDIFLNMIKERFNLEGKLLEEAVESVKRFYLGDKNISKDITLELLDFTSDFIGNYAGERAVTRFLNQSAILYKYLFSYTGNSPYKDVEGVGAEHAEELQYLFYRSKEEELSGDDNILMRDRMTAMWANFVKYGNPTPHNTDLLPVEWKHTSQNTRSYLDIDLNMKMKDNVYKNRMEFWDRFWQTYGKYRKPYRPASVS